MANSNLTKDEFLSQLGYKLRVLPKNDRHDALEYYEGYLSDADDVNTAITQLGSPGEVAAIILADHVEKGVDLGRAEGGGFWRRLKSSSGGIKAVWLVILALFALPIGFPVLILLSLIPFMLFVFLGTFVITFAGMAISFFGLGIVSMLLSPFVMVNEFGFGLIVAGSGVFTVGLGILMTRFLLLTMSGFGALAKFISRKIRRRAKSDGRYQTV